MVKTIVTGAAGFIGFHLVNYLKRQGNYVLGLDMKYPKYGKSVADDFEVVDLRDWYEYLLGGFDEVYHLAADMGGIGYIETHKADIVYNNSIINMSILKNCVTHGIKRLLFTSSACVYPSYIQNVPNVKPLIEEEAYPAQAEDGYGWEKLMMERACRHFMEDYKLPVYIARLHNIYGPYGAYDGGREKSPAAICRKVIQAKNEIELWGDGTRTRSYCYVDDCVEGLYKLMNSDYHSPINIGTDELVTIKELAEKIIKISGKKLEIKYDLTRPQGVVGRNADISKANLILAWYPKVSLNEGLGRTYQWIKQQLSLENQL